MIMMKNQEEEETTRLTLSPSFRTDASPESISAVDFSQDAHSDDDDGFEFSISAASPVIDAADEIFSNGRILPVYPLFNRNLLIESVPDPTEHMRTFRVTDLAELRSGSTSSTSSADSLDIDGGGALQSPERCRKSASTGSGRRWRMRDLVRRRRSYSDGKEKFGFCSNSDPKPEGEGKKKEKKKDVKEMDLVAAHRMFYGNGRREEQKRRSSFLPYRQELVGLFSSSRGTTHFHPF